jgi:cell division protein FtsQ
VSIVDDTDNHFIVKEDVFTLLSDKRIDLVGEKLSKMNRSALEEVLDKHPTIKKSQIYNNHLGIVSIDITQRKPIVRVVNQNEESYYIDEEGFLMPLSDNFSAHVIIANGYLNESYNSNNKQNVVVNNKKNGGSEKLRAIYTLASFINADPFWKAQIEQIYFNRKGEIELAPRVGTHIIIFGNIVDYKEKFRKLRAVYDQGFKKTGWNKYRIINLKYKDQVICTKK